MKKTSSVLFRIFEYLAAVTLAVMVILMSLQVLFRFVLNSPLAWTEELARYTFIWSTFIASFVAAVKGEHVAIKMLQDKVSGLARIFLVMISDLLTACFFGIVSYCSVSQWDKLSSQTSAALKIPMSYVYLGIIIGCSGMFLWYLYRSIMAVVDGVRKKEG